MRFFRDIKWWIYYGGRFHPDIACYYETNNYCRGNWLLIKLPVIFPIKVFRVRTLEPISEVSSKMRILQIFNGLMKSILLICISILQIRSTSLAFNLSKGHCVFSPFYSALLYFHSYMLILILSKYNKIRNKVNISINIKCEWNIIWGYRVSNNVLLLT